MSLLQPPRLDVLRPFQLEGSQLRGRLVRLGEAVDSVLKAHAYPRAVSDLLGELLVLAGGLAGGLKFAGRFSLQIRAEGPVRLMVADVTNDGQMRGYASFDADAMGEIGVGDEAGFADLVGKGLLALTVDQAASGGETYQGIVQLDGRSLQDSMLVYFHQSEQVPTGIRSAVRYDEAAGAWRAAAVIVQAMPGEGAISAAEREDDWRRTMLLLETLSDDELLDPALGPDTLLFRLFHEDGVRVFDSLDLRFGCSCDDERVATMLRRFERDEVLAMQDGSGKVTVTCEFCSRVYRFTPADIAALFEDSLH
jgi:molecular chaperone Hsp33